MCGYKSSSSNRFARILVVVEVNCVLKIISVIRDKTYHGFKKLSRERQLRTRRVAVERVLPGRENDVKFRVVGCFAPPLDCAADLNNGGGRQIVGAR